MESDILCSLALVGIVLVLVLVLALMPMLMLLMMLSRRASDIRVTYVYHTLLNPVRPAKRRLLPHYILDKNRYCLIIAKSSKNVAS